MTKNIIPQIAALYLGQKCDIEWLFTDPEDVFMKGDKWSGSEIIPATIDRLIKGHLKITPHLRPLSSLTEMEARELYEIAYGEHWTDAPFSCITWLCMEPDECEEYTPIDEIVGCVEAWLKLLELGFDLFGLIGAGLAIDKQNLEK